MGEEGQTLQVGEVICKIETEGANPAEQKQEQPAASTAAETPAAKSAEAADQPNKKRYSPAVLRLAGEHSIDLEQVTGTGAGGRITRKDIQRLIETGGVQEQNPEEPKTAGSCTEVCIKT